jgi:N-acetyl-1-D-myo-inositol-2-amino-2-deoxy-alpha-D-glucopyranoside deacetylase
MTQRRMLVCFAHPDDEAFAAAGFLASSTARQVTVRLVCATRGEEGDIRFPGSAERDTLGEVRQQELRQSCQVLGLEAPIVLGYRDSGWGDSPAQHHPNAFVKASPEMVICRLVAEIRRFRPHVVMTFEPGGLSGHKDHITISHHTTAAFHAAGQAEVYPQHQQWGLKPIRPARLFYVARPLGFRLQRALKLRQAGVEVPLPAPELRNQGVPSEDIHITLDVSHYLDRKLASMRCHRTQIRPDWPFARLPRQVIMDLLGREYFIRAYPPVPSGVTLPADVIADIAIDTY